MKAKMKFYPIPPTAKPRMTRSDKWKQRPCVMKYRAFKDLIRAYNFELPEFYHMIFFIEIPKSWSKKKKIEMLYQPHKQTPDKDNLEKAVLDSLFKNDSHIWTGECSKVWADFPGIVVIEKQFNWGLLKQAVELHRILQGFEEIPRNGY